MDDVPSDGLELKKHSHKHRHHKHHHRHHHAKDHPSDDTKVDGSSKESHQKRGKVRVVIGKEQHKSNMRYHTMADAAMTSRLMQFISMCLGETMDDFKEKFHPRYPDAMFYSELYKDVRKLWEQGHIPSEPSTHFVISDQTNVRLIERSREQSAI